MALVIHMKKDQRLIINGAVLENVSGRTVAIAIKNEAAILRSEDVLTADAADTPARRVYFALQCAYLFPDTQGDHLRDFLELLASYLQAAPSADAIGRGMHAAVESGNFYGALKLARRLIEHESEILARVQVQAGAGRGPTSRLARENCI